ncbi:vesicle transport protein GOT1 [Sesamum indicum]|uniref:Vesicle transport protein GOT1 n=1 Tax=Sesamum indicum TaxID=4182 RepID=A0A8M8V0U1_SESIN|nr:vesicle transport protein GOT1 [Sesamum indicum]XP_020552725.1 vesicle transport protein GOT1 [Sesamum indicum]
MVSFETSDLKKVGLGLTGFGFIFTFAGVLLIFDEGFLTIGNILFLSGMILTIGVKSSLHFFMKPQNYKAAVSFGVGFFFVITGWPIIGMIVEAYGFVVLFSEFRPSIAIFFRKLPIIGWMLHQPYVPAYFVRQRGRRVPV